MGKMSEGEDTKLNKGEKYAQGEESLALQIILFKCYG